MAHITMTLSDTPDGGVSIHTDFKPSVGNPCTPAQGYALDVIAKTHKQWGIPKDTSETRRPGITEMCERLQREHPNWDASRCHAEAKAAYTEPHQRGAVETQNAVPFHPV